MAVTLRAADAPTAPATTTATRYRQSHLAQLENEAIHIVRETAAQFERPVLLFSGGKDSIVMVHLARKAFWPGRFPFPLLHIDTGHNFPETLKLRWRGRPARRLSATEEPRDDGSRP